MAEYNDYTHLTETEMKNINLLAEAIRHKVYGIDVRESIALAIELLLDISAKENNDAVAEITKARNEFGTLDDRLDDIVADLNNLSVSQINKNLGKIDQTYLTDELIAQIAGTAAINAVPADNSLTTVKYVDNSVTTAKRTPLGNFGFISSTGNINIDTVNKRIVLPATTGVIVGKKYYDVSSRTVSLANTHSLNGGFLGYDTVSNTFIFGSESTFNENTVFIGAIWMNARRFLLNATTYTVDAKANINTNGLVTSKLYGKKWNALGDSITYGMGTTKTYHQYIAEKIGMTVNNYGINSTEISQGGTYANPFISRYVNMDVTADLITVFGGVNDFLHNVALGDFSSRDNATFYGALHNLCQGLYTNFPNAKYAFITPMRTKGTYGDGDVANSKGHILADYVQAIKETAGYYGIPVMDMFNFAGITPLVATSKTKYMPDGLHPNATGHQVISDKIMSFLETL